MKTLFLSIFLITSCACMAQQQYRESMLGIRAGGSAGFTYKKFMGSRFAFETMVAKDFPKEQDGVFIAALFEKHAPLLGNKFSALAGAGPSYHFTRKSLGVVGMLGFDWRILNAPVNLQVDWSPAYYFNATQQFSPINGALSVRYILNRKNLKQREQ